MYGCLHRWKATAYPLVWPNRHATHLKQSSSPSNHLVGPCKQSGIRAVCKLTAVATIRLVSSSDILYTHALQTVTTAQMNLLLPTLSLQQLLGCESSHALSHPAPLCTVLLEQALQADIWACKPVSSMLRPYHPETTPSRPIREVKLDWAQLVLG